MSTTAAEASLHFSGKAVTAWGGLALMQRMLSAIGFRAAAGRWSLPPPGSNRGFEPVMLIEQFLVSVWCGANRFSQLEINRYDRVLARVFGWTKCAGHRAVVRLFERFDLATSSRVQQEIYSWFFSQLSIKRVTLDVDSSVITRWGKQQQGARVGYNPRNHGRASHHPLIAFVADCRMIANFWLRPGDCSSAGNMLSFLETTRQNLGKTIIALLRADSGFFADEILKALEHSGTDYVVAAKLTAPLQAQLMNTRGWWALEPGLELCEFDYQAGNWGAPRRMVAIRQSAKLRATAPGKTLSLFKDDPDMKLWRYGVVCTTLKLSALEVWRTYRGRADCENRIKELKADFGLESFNLRDFWATEAALTTTMLAYNLMSLFRQSLMRASVQATMATLRHQVFAAPAWCADESGPRADQYTVALPRQRRAWFSGLWSAALDPPGIPNLEPNTS
jgi:hypothetical protein